MRLDRLIKALFREMNTIMKYVKFLSQCAVKPRRYMELQVWEKTGFSAPSPPFVKRTCLSRNAIPGSTFVESGTFLGETTRYLGERYPKVISIEPEPKLFENARRLFERNANVEILNGTSETVFPNLIPQLRGDVSFWLDGHNSNGITYKASTDTPIACELQVIEENISNFGKISVCIDDVRCFISQSKEYEDYPDVTYLISWADRNSLHWHIEHDIFVATNSIP
jgi:hypothetical protein